MTNKTISSEPAVLVTGAARRIGAIIAQTLHAAGMRIGIHYRDSRQEAMALCEDLNQQRIDSACCLQGDLNRLEDIERLAGGILDHFGRLDVLVNNASSFYPTPIEHLREAAFDDLIAGNLKGPAFLISHLAPALRRQRGCIINISDIHARQPLAAHPIYCAAKAGLEGLTRALAQDLGPQIRVNGIAPGAILWPSTDAESDTHERAGIIADTALKRLGETRDVANAVLYLIREARYTTGQILNVDGGRR